MQSKTNLVNDLLVVEYSFRKIFIIRISHNLAAVFALLVFLSILLLSFGAPWVAAIFHTNPTDQNLINNLAPWFSQGHILGTDELGRDVFIRTLFAGRISLSIGFSVALLQLLCGLVFGLIAGYYGNWADDIINALLQIIRGIPLFFLLIVFSVLFRPTLFNLIVVLGLLGWSGTCRQVRGLVLSIKQKDYIEATRALGTSAPRILIHHILPNIISIILVVASSDIASTIITESSLSFLGFGVQPPMPSWGNMLNSALNNTTIAPWLIITPGLFLTLTVFCIFLAADGIRDALDPQLYL